MGRRSNSSNKKYSSNREQAPKQARGFERGHGAHHRYQPGKGAPRSFGSGRGRTGEKTRTKDFSRLDDESLGDVNLTEKRANVEKRVEATGEAQTFGVALAGTIERGVVVEVVKGNFLTRLLTENGALEGTDTTAATPTPRWKQGDILRTIVRGVLQHFDLGLSSLVAPGDEIELIVPPSSGPKVLFQAGLHGILTRVFPRRNEFRRLHPSGRTVQTLAANVDRVVVVASAAEPDFRPGFVDRVLVCAASSGIPSVLVLNKVDLGVLPRDEELLNMYAALGIPVIRVCARDPASAGGMDRLKELLAGSRSVLTGHSGVGKSSLMQALDGSLTEETARTGDISTQTGKGTHTTTHARLFQLSMGASRNAEVIDTPGVREFTPADTDRRNLWGWFPEIAKLQGQCPYPDCMHTVEKDCAVLAAVERGEIHPRRHRSYVRIYETLAE